MSKYINRATAYDALCGLAVGATATANAGYRRGVNDAAMAITKLPAADVRKNVKGKWDVVEGWDGDVDVDED